MLAGLLRGADGQTKVFGMLLAATRVPAAAALLAGPRFDVPGPGTRLRWGLGHMINADAVSGGRRAGSLTWAGLYNTYYWIDPATRVAGVIMMQILPFADTKSLPLFYAFEGAAYGR